jgi:hypothetical protein
VAIRGLILTALLAAGCGPGETIPDVTGEPETVELAEDAQPAPQDIVEPEDVVDTWAEPLDDDALTPWDLPETDLIEADPDVEEKTPDAFTNCPTLGVSEYWAGEFEGVVTYDLDDPDGDQKQQGLYLVKGQLNFAISCLDQKLLVSGQLKGEGEAAGFVGEHPFAANLFGDFNYITRTIDAAMTDGEVRIYKVISVFFEGAFTGGVQQDGNFTGEWDGLHVGNDLNLEGDAEGYGTWWAKPAPKPEEPEDP